MAWIGAVLAATGTIGYQVCNHNIKQKSEEKATKERSDNTKTITDKQDEIGTKLDSITSKNSADSKNIDSILGDQQSIKSQLDELSKDLMTQKEKENLLREFGDIISKEINKIDFKKSDRSDSEYIETTDEHKKQRIKVTLESAQSFYEKESGFSSKQYVNHKIGTIGFDFQDFTVRNSKYNSKIRNKIIGAIGKLFSDSIDGSWRYRSLGDTYILFVPILNEEELLRIAKKIHVVLNSYDWEEFDTEFFLNTITTYTTISNEDDIEDRLRFILKSLMVQKADGIVFDKAIEGSSSKEELYTLISYKKLKK